MDPGTACLCKFWKSQNNLHIAVHDEILILILLTLALYSFNCCVATLNLALYRQNACQGHMTWFQHRSYSVYLQSVCLSNILKYPVFTGRQQPAKRHQLTNWLTPCSKVLPQKITGPQSRNSPNFLDPDGLLLHSQQSANCSYPGLGKFNLFLPIPLLDDPF